MVEAGVNLVTLPVFSWPLLEPRPGRVRLRRTRPRHRPALGARHPHRPGHGDRDPAGLAGARASRGPALERRRRPPRVRLAPVVLPELADLPRGGPAADPHARRALRRASGARPLARLERVRRPRVAVLVPRVWRGTSAAGSRDRYETIDGLNEAWGTSCWGQHYLDFEPDRATAHGDRPDQPGRARRLRAVLVGCAARALPVPRSTCCARSPPTSRSPRTS